MGIKYSRMKSMVSEFDIGMFSLHSWHKTHNFPGKLLGYMAQAVPILGSVNQDNDLIDLIEANEAGLISVNGDDESFFDNAVKLYKNRELRMKIGLAGNTLMQSEFAVTTAATTITEFFAESSASN